jgi:hypothetical protein
MIGAIDLSAGSQFGRVAAQPCYVSSKTRALPFPNHASHASSVIGCHPSIAEEGA